MPSVPPPLIQCCLEGLRFHQGNFGGKAALIRGRGERFVVVSGFQGQSSHYFVRDWGYGLLLLVNSYWLARL